MRKKEERTTESKRAMEEKRGEGKSDRKKGGGRGERMESEREGKDIGYIPHKIHKLVLVAYFHDCHVVM